MERHVVDILPAAGFAAHRHRAQRRTGDAEEPYINHAVEAARLVAEATGG